MFASSSSSSDKPHKKGHNLFNEYRIDEMSVSIKGNFKLLQIRDTLISFWSVITEESMIFKEKKNWELKMSKIGYKLFFMTFKNGGSYLK